MSNEEHPAPTPEALPLPDKPSIAVLPFVNMSSDPILGVVYLWGKKQHEQAIAKGERTIALDPNYADGYVSLGTALMFAGRPEEAIGLLGRAMRLNPYYPATYLSMLGQASRLTGQYEEGIAAYQRALSRNPNFLPAHLGRAIIFSESGREGEARAAAAEILRVSPNYSLEVARQRIPFKDPAVLECTLANLRKAGLK